MADEFDLNFEAFDPAKEMAETRNLLAETGLVSATASQPVQAGESAATDYKGRTFDPEIHMADETGKPIISHGNIRIKKTMAGKIRDFFTGKPEEGKNGFSSEKVNIPKSDHEVKEENDRFAAVVSDLDANSEDAANTMWVVYSATLGPEALNQYEKLHPKLKKHFELFERRTGKSVDLPPGVSLAIGIATVGFEIIRAEPECKTRFDATKDVVARNLGGYVKNVFAPKNIPAEKEEKTDG